MAAAWEEQTAHQQAEKSEKEVAARVGPCFTLFADGSVERKAPLPHRASDGRTSKDVSIDKERGQWARIFLPSASEGLGDMLPVVLYFHGGGMLFGGPEWDNFHSFCEAMAARSRAVWVSANYRLAPEHRLPTPIDDASAALRWLVRSLREGEEPHWLGRADLSRLFVAGESAGGVIAHHVAAAAATAAIPIPIRGVILIHPGFFDCMGRTQQELDCFQDEYMSWDMADACVPLLLPPGRPLSDACPVLNPVPAILASPSSFRFPPRTLVALADRDALHFLALRYIHALGLAGLHVEHIVSHGMGHVFYIYLPHSQHALTLMDTIATFIREGENA